MRYSSHEGETESEDYLFDGDALVLDGPKAGETGFARIVVSIGWKDMIN